MSSIAVIANPHAGPGRGRLSLDEAVEMLAEQGLSPIAMPTEGPGHATELAAQAAVRGLDAVVAVGGDGTVHETARGLTGTGCPLGVLPSGSGNDFAMGIGCSTAAEGLAAISGGHVATFDTARLDERFFVNSVGLLASGLVSLRAARLWRWLGRRRYLLASLRTLLAYRGQEVQWRCLETGREFGGRFLLAEICNGPSTGGGFRFAPDARFDDGHLDACLVRPVGLGTAMRLLGPAARGERLDHPAITLLETGRMSFTTPEAVGYHLDGEAAMLPAGRHEITLVPGDLKVLVPEG